MNVAKGGSSTLDDPFLPFVRTGIRPGLGRIRKILVALKRPDRSYQSILVAGSNGKGTTAAMLARTLQELNLRSGLFTSPHLISVHERFQVNGRLAGSRDIHRFLRIHGAACRKVGATYFEVTTAFALWWFAESRVDWAVLEVGLGGRWDACNAVAPELSIITSISKEHTEFLGATLAEIAVEKARTARRGKPVIIGSLPRAAAVAVRRELAKVGAKMVWPDTRPQSLSVRAVPSGSVVRLDVGCVHQDVSLGMRGQNAAVAATLAASAICTLSQNGSLTAADVKCARALKTGLLGFRWPARLHVAGRTPLTVIDVAHNSAAILALTEEWKRIWPNLRPVIVTALLADKKPAQIGPLLARLSSRIVITSAESPRGLPPHKLAVGWRTLFHRLVVEPELSQALARARRLAGRRGAVLVLGSHYLAGPVLRLLKVTPFAP